MRKGWTLLLVTAGLYACGQYTVQEGPGGGGTPTPTNSASPTPSGNATASPPPEASFATDIQPFLTPNNCGASTACHMSGAAQASVIVTTNPQAADIQANYTNLACSAALASFNPPSGTLIDNFCNSNGTAITPASAQHSGYVNSQAGPGLTDQNCAALIAWISSGGTGTVLPTCHS